MTKILVTGAKGMLGQDLCLMLKDEGFEVFEADIHNMDITGKEQVEQVLQSEKPDYIIHTAAYTDVDKAETDRDKAFLINETGSRNIAEVSGIMDIPVFYISTDYVFDGTKNSPYMPDDPVNPINVYGESKLAGEIAIKENNSKYYILRISWLYGHKGKNFVETMINLASKNNEVKVVDDQIGCPTWTVELSRTIVSFLKQDKPYGIYHVCGSGSVSWFGFASKIMELMNIDVKLIPVTTEEFPRPAVRPACSIMDNAGICSDWQESLEKYIKLRDMIK